MLLKIRILSEEGDKEESCTSIEKAMQLIKDNLKNGEWIFIDGKYYSLEEIDKDILEEASECIITPKIQGG